jgi:hypothetical protein
MADIPFDLYIDAGAPGGLPCLLAGATLNQGGVPHFMAGDTVQLRAHFREIAANEAGVYEVGAYALPAGAAVYASVRASAGSATIAATASMAYVGTDEDDTFWEAALALSVQDVYDALGDAESVDLLIDVVATWGSGATARRMTWRIEATLHAPVEETPGSELPDGLVGNLWRNGAVGNVRMLANGDVQFWDYTTEKWRRPVLNGGALGWDEGEDE